MTNTSPGKGPDPAGAFTPKSLLGVADETRKLCYRVETHTIDLTLFLKECARLVARSINCSRAGIWTLNEGIGHRSLRCLALYDETRDQMVKVPDETDVEPYIRALVDDGFIVAPDAHSHPATSQLFSVRLQARGVRSLLASSFSVNGRLFGAFTCTQINSRHDWSMRQLATLRLIGGPSSAAIVRASRLAPSTEPGLFDDAPSPPV